MGRSSLPAGVVTLMGWLTSALILLAIGAPANGADPVEFETEVFPLLEARCIDCHGPDAQEGRLRLDAKGVVLGRGNPKPLVMVGKPDESVLFRRVVGLDDKPRMPLDDQPLGDDETALLRRWIEEGARWPEGVGSDATEVAKHWAYVAPVRPEPPTVAQADWPRNAIDRFVLARLEREGLRPSAQADRARLARRVSLDLTGVPPTIAEVDAFLADDRDDAYERVVDRLLDSPRFGERWTRPWLDAARYAESNGYQRDGHRQVWAYRDWVVDALNADMPFSRFTIEQLAGDLAPNATLAQRIATGFNRGTMVNVEAGTDPEEERNLAIIDRVNTTGTVWLGTTLECAQCHDHKYDPFTQEEYYRLFAFFNNTEKEIQTFASRREFVGPKIELPDPANAPRRSKLTQRLDRLRRQIDDRVSELATTRPRWERQAAEASKRGLGWTVLRPDSFLSLGGATLSPLKDGSLLASGIRPATDVYEVSVSGAPATVRSIRLEILADPSLPDGGPARTLGSAFGLSEFKVETPASGDPSSFVPVALARVQADFGRQDQPIDSAIDGDPKTGWTIDPKSTKDRFAIAAIFAVKAPISLGADRKLRVTLDQQFGRRRTIGRFRLLASDLDLDVLEVPEPVRAVLAVAPDRRNDNQKAAVAKHHQSLAPRLVDLRARVAELEKEFEKVAPPTTLVMKELPEPRPTNVLLRGDFLKKGKPVMAGTPALLPPWPKGTRTNRRSLAEWLVDGRNPLVARVTVNRIWAEYFGRGLVESLEDFGTRSIPPSHPDLLDWLATELPRTGWSLKAIHRAIVTSATYRQDARVGPELLRRDPKNVLYARGPRLRMPAEMIRDNALAVSGLLCEQLAGPPVFPKQPAGIWNVVGKVDNRWRESKGADAFRRGLYTYWRRSSPYPSFVAFDAPSREACIVKRSRSNTPLQALTLLNDPVYVEAACALAGRILAEPANASPAARAAYGFRLCVAREPTPEEIEILTDRYRFERERFARDRPSAERLVANARPVVKAEPVELAAWFFVANALLNLDETITK